MSSSKPRAIIRFFSDPHEGRELKANTTAASRQLLQQQLHLHALQAAKMPIPGYENGERGAAITICGGDLFDTDNNPEHVIISGAEVAALCHVVVGGNHDVINVANRESSLSVLAKLTYDERFVMPPEPGKLKVDHREIAQGVFLTTIPHHARQQEFEEALDQAFEYQESLGEGNKGRNLLLLHCNYHLTMEAGENDLNLPDAKARWLLQQFDYIVLGHDHRPRFECDGRLLILGNTHPTSFSDQGEKRVWFYHAETNDWSYAVNAEDASRVISATELIELHRSDALQVLAGVEWLDVRGELPPEAAVDLAKAIRATWKAVPYLYAIRASKVLFRAEGLAAGVEVDQTHKTLIELVEEDLKGSDDLLALFNEARAMKE